MAPSLMVLFGTMAMCNAAVDNTATIEADGNGNIVAAVAEGNKVRTTCNPRVSRESIRKNSDES